MLSRRRLEIWWRWFLHWFRSNPVADPGNAAAAALPERLKVLEREAEQARLGFRGAPLNRASDLCMQAKESERALEYYGGAIDAYLHDGHPEVARGVAQKLIRVHPGAVRTYCTLTWLDLGLGYVADARTHVDGYVAAARRAGHENLAVPQVKEMARTMTDLGFREAAATALHDLGDHAARAGASGQFSDRPGARYPGRRGERALLRCGQVVRPTPQGDQGLAGNSRCRHGTRPELLRGADAACSELRLGWVAERSAHREPGNAAGQGLLGLNRLSKPTN